MGVKIDIKEIKGLGKDIKTGRETILVKLENEEQRREIWKKKSALKGRRERIQEDWTWGERRMRWRLEEIARREEREGKRVWIGYGTIKINEEWWIWDEEEEVLQDRKGNIKGEKKERKQGKGEKRKKWKEYREKKKGGGREEEGDRSREKRRMESNVLECGRIDEER